MRPYDLTMSYHTLCLSQTVHFSMGHAFQSEGLGTSSSTRIPVFSIFLVLTFSCTGGQRAYLHQDLHSPQSLQVIIDLSSFVITDPNSIVDPETLCATQGKNMDAPVEIWGEDALLQWPGARQPIITERDAYMARTIWSAATGAFSILHHLNSSEWHLRQYSYQCIYCAAWG
jgi:hypothetical protein